VAELHIVRKHGLGLAKARKIALDWAEQVERDFGMEPVPSTIAHTSTKQRIYLRWIETLSG
jgi:hypothetical protein